MKTLYCEPVVKFWSKEEETQAAWRNGPHTILMPGYQKYQSLGAKKSFVTGTESFPNIPDYFPNGPEKTPPKFCAGYFFGSILFLRNRFVQVTISVRCQSPVRVFKRGHIAGEGIQLTKVEHT